MVSVRQVRNTGLYRDYGNRKKALIQDSDWSLSSVEIKNFYMINNVCLRLFSFLSCKPYSLTRISLETPLACPKLLCNHKSAEAEVRWQLKPGDSKPGIRQNPEEAERGREGRRKWGREDRKESEGTEECIESLSLGKVTWKQRHGIIHRAATNARTQIHWKENWEKRKNRDGTVLKEWREA